MLKAGENNLISINFSVANANCQVINTDHQNERNKCLACCLYSWTSSAAMNCGKISSRSRYCGIPWPRQQKAKRSLQSYYWSHRMENFVMVHEHNAGVLIELWHYSPEIFTARIYEASLWFVAGVNRLHSGENHSHSAVLFMTFLPFLFMIF